MKNGVSRGLLLAAIGTLLILAAVPGEAQQPSPTPTGQPGKTGAKPTVQTDISYAANSAAAGVTVALTPPGATEPAAGVFGASTNAEITSDGPAANGKADALAVLTQSPVSASSKAPPDAPEDTANSPVPALTVPGVGSLAALQGTANSKSEAEDGLPSTENTSTFTATTLSIPALPSLPVLGIIGGGVTVGGSESKATAGATAETQTTAASNTTGLSIRADLDVSGLGTVCNALPAGPLRDACNSLATPAQVINVTVGPASVTCTWNGANADCEGSAAAATVTLAGQAPQTVAPGQTVTIPPTGPFLVRVRAGAFAETTGQDPPSASGIASGISVELVGQDPARPGLLTVAIGQATASLSGEITQREVIAATGGPLLPALAGGAILVIGAVALRRYLRRSWRPIHE